MYILRLIGYAFRLLIIAVLTVWYLFAVQSEIYTFNQPRPFSGEYWYNPYDSLPPVLLKANFHAHSKAYGGTTNGAQNTEIVINAYKMMGYDVIAVSDYFKPHPFRKDSAVLIVPAYEHGINIFKTHRNVIGVPYAVFYDIPINITLSNKQYVLAELLPHSRVLAINHPKFVDGHTVEDVKYLQGYSNMEVLNHFRNSSEYWDSALSAGRPVWIIGNDDTHDINKSNETGVNLTMIFTETREAEQVYSSLRSGKAYGVVTQGGVTDSIFSGIKVKNNQYQLGITQRTDSIHLIGQWGKTLLRKYNTDTLSYQIQIADTYIRAVVYSGERSYYFNPVMRYNGKTIPENLQLPKTDFLFTAFYRVCLTVLWAVCSVVVYYTAKRQKVLKKNN